MPAAPFITRRLIREFIEKNGRTPNKNKFIAIQHEAMNTVFKNNSVYGICGQGGTEMTESVFKGKPTVGQDIDHTLDPRVAFTSYHEHEDQYTAPYVPLVSKKLAGKKSNLIMTKEMYEDFVKQGKKFVNLLGESFDSLDESNIDIDGDTVIVDGQVYLVNMFAWRK